MNDEWTQTTLGDLLMRVRRRVEVQPGVTYPAASVRHFGQGLGAKDPFVGGETNYKHLFEVCEGDVVVRTITAFESPVGVANADHRGTHVSQVFLTYTAGEKALPAYLALVFQTPDFWEHMRDRAQGTVLRRKTISASNFESIPLSLPPLVVQQRIVDLMEHLDTHLANLETEREAWLRTHVSLREHITSGWEEKPLQEFASIEARLVDPRDPMHAPLLHIGIERIDKGTGRLLPLQTAADEGLISSKYLFSDSDVIYSKIRPNLRKVTYPGFVGLCSADAYPLRPIPGLAPNLLCEALLVDRVVESVVAKSGRTKMPKVNRTELFSIPVPLAAPGGEQEWREASDLLRSSAEHLEVLEEALVAASSMRQTVLEMVLRGRRSITDSYDSLLAVS